MGKFAFDLDYLAYQNMVTTIEDSGVPYTELLPLLADIGGSGIQTLIGVVDAPTGNNLIPEIACSKCEKTVMGVLKGGGEAGNVCACSECDEPIITCSMFRVTDEQLNAARMISDAQHKKTNMLEKRRRWWQWK